MNEQQVLEKLKRAVATAPSQSAWATQHGISPQHLSDTLNGHRGLGPAILNALGYERIVTYRQMRT